MFQSLNTLVLLGIWVHVMGRAMVTTETKIADVERIIFAPRVIKQPTCAMKASHSMAKGALKRPVNKTTPAMQNQMGIIRMFLLTVEATSTARTERKLIDLPAEETMSSMVTNVSIRVPTLVIAYTIIGS